MGQSPQPDTRPKEQRTPRRPPTSFTRPVTLQQCVGGAFFTQQDLELESSRILLASAGMVDEQDGNREPAEEVQVTLLALNAEELKVCTGPRKKRFQ